MSYSTFLRNKHGWMDETGNQSITTALQTGPGTIVAAEASHQSAC